MEWIEILLPTYIDCPITSLSLKYNPSLMQKLSMSNFPLNCYVKWWWLKSQNYEKPRKSSCINIISFNYILFPICFVIQWPMTEQISAVQSKRSVSCMQTKYKIRFSCFGQQIYLLTCIYYNSCNQENTKNHSFTKSPPWMKGIINFILCTWFLCSGIYMIMILVLYPWWVYKSRCYLQT